MILKKILFFFIVQSTFLITYCSTIRLINDSNVKIFVTAKKIGCIPICSSTDVGPAATQGTTSTCCMTKRQGKAPTLQIPPQNFGWTIPGRASTTAMPKSEFEDFAHDDYTFYVYPIYGDTVIGARQYSKTGVNSGTVLRFPQDFMPQEEGMKFLFPGEEWKYPCKISIPDGYYEPISANILTFRQITNYITQDFIYDNQCKGLNFIIPAAKAKVDDKGNTIKDKNDNAIITPVIIQPTYGEVTGAKNQDDQETGGWGKAEDLTFKNLADPRVDPKIKDCQDQTPYDVHSETYPITFKPLNPESAYSLIFTVYPSQISPKVEITLRDTDKAGKQYTDFITRIELPPVKKEIENRRLSMIDTFVKGYSNVLPDKTALTNAVGVPFIWLAITIKPGVPVDIDNIWVQFRAPEVRQARSGTICNLVDAFGNSIRYSANSWEKPLLPLITKYTVNKPLADSDATGATTTSK